MDTSYKCLMAVSTQLAESMRWQKRMELNHCRSTHRTLSKTCM
uniref:Uncharacterized protein n=1 Tax=Romanomermis culicivorax TaxID=13658 RepID=A0A915JKP8_ROMCU